MSLLTGSELYKQHIQNLLLAELQELVTLIQATLLDRQKSSGRRRENAKQWASWLRRENKSHRQQQVSGR